MSVAGGTAESRLDRPSEDIFPRNRWLGVGSIAAGAFLLVTTEFLPIGLLSKLASGLHVSIGMAGLAVTAPGFIAAFAAPLLAILAKETDRRVLMIAFTIAIVSSNVIAALSPNFGVFLLARIVLGLAVGGLWTFAVAVGRRLVPESAGARATSVIATAISAGTIFGMPAGALFGAWAGWRMVFAATVAIGLVIVLLQFRFLPRVAASAAVDLAALKTVAKTPMVRIALVVSGLAVGGHFVAYTFLEPYLRDGLALKQLGVALALAGYALMGIAGSFLGERLAARDVSRAFAATCFALGVSVLAAIATTEVPAIAVIMVMLWGVAFGVVPVCALIWMHKASPSQFEAASALMVSIFQISVAAGSLVGGTLVDHSGIRVAFVACGAVAFAGAAVALLSNRWLASPSILRQSKG